MRFLPVIAFFSLLLNSCSTPSDPEEIYHTDSVADTLQKTDSVIAVQKCEFDIRKFKIITDSVLAMIVNKADTFRIDPDTTSFVSADVRNFFYPLSIGNGSSHRYFLEAPKKSAYYGFWFVISEFPDSSSALKAFTELHKRSRDEEPRDQFMPGLTYENDYLLLEGTHIYWLNTGCVYGGPVNSILRNTFRASTCERIYQDSIIVYCGDRAKN